MKRILIINGHPAEQSLCRTIAERYAKAAQEHGHTIRQHHLPEMDFDADHGYGGYRVTKPLEPSLESILVDLHWAEHIVLTTPIWWGGVPAKLKGLFDRALLPGRTFNPRIIECGAPKPLLTGKTARVIVTSDTAGWLMALVYCNALFIQLKRQVFGFVGIKPTRITHFNEASHPAETTVSQWLDTVARLGTQAH